MIELIVAMGIFLVLISAATGGFVQSLRTQRALVALMAANDNASLILEQMARELRVGYNFATNPAGDELTFINARNEIVTYRVSNEKIERGVGGLGGPGFEPLTADIVRIDGMRFRLQGDQAGGEEAARVTVNLVVGARGRGVETIQVHMQTTASARLLRVAFEE